MTCIRLEYALVNHLHIGHHPWLTKDVRLIIRSLYVASIVWLVGYSWAYPHLQIFAHLKRVTHGVGRHATA